MTAPIHIARTYNEIFAQDVDRALGFVGTVQTVIYAIGAGTIDGDIKHAQVTLDLARQRGQFLEAWFYPGAGAITSGKIKVTDPALVADAKKAADQLRAHIANGGLGGGASILSECGDDWKITPATFIAAYEAVAAVVPKEFVRVWALTPMKGLSNAMAYRPPSAQLFALHPYGLKSVDFTTLADGTLKANTTPAARALALLEAASVAGLPLLGFDEAGVIDVVDIADSGKTAWLNYYKPCFDLLTRYGGRMMFMASEDWKFGTWLDGRWAPTLSVEEGHAKYPLAPLAWFGAPGCPEACAVMTKKFATGIVAKAVASPFAVGGAA